MSTYESRAEFVNNLRSALSTQDREGLSQLVTEDVVWALPGSNAGVAMVLHNTGQHNGVVLDEYLVSAVTLDGDKASRIDTYISDIPMMNAYFV